MSNGYVQLPIDQTGKKLRTRTLIEDTETVHDEVVRISNDSGVEINPATEESLSNIAMSITNALDSTAFDLNAAAFSEVTNISNDFILDSIELNFSTVESKTITITTADGTILYQDTNTSTSVKLTDINDGYNSGDNITVAVTQFASAGIMDCILRVRQGSNTLVGNPVLGAGNEIIGKVKITDGTTDVNIHDNHLNVINYAQGIGHGSADGDIETKRAIGKKSAITTGAYTILESNTFIQPIADTQMYLQSASANDTATGSGAQQITIKYFSLSWGAEKTVQVTPDGINQVTIPVTDINRIQEVFVNKGSAAADNITITNQAETVLYGGIDQYETFMERCILYVAENKRLTITQVILGSTTSGGVNIRLFVSEEDSDGNVVTRGRDVIEIADNTSIVNLKPWESVTNPNNKRIAVGLAVNGNSPSQKCTGTLKVFIETI